MLTQLTTQASNYHREHSEYLLMTVFLLKVSIFLAILLTLSHYFSSAYRLGYCSFQV